MREPQVQAGGPGHQGQAGALRPQHQPGPRHAGARGGGARADVLFVFVHISHLSFNHRSGFDFHKKETCSNYFSVEVKRYLMGGRNLDNNNALQERPGRPRGTGEIPRGSGSREVLHSVR